MEEEDEWGGEERVTKSSRRPGIFVSGTLEGAEALMARRA
jgi:hypothetical protein